MICPDRTAVAPEAGRANRFPRLASRTKSFAPNTVMTPDRDIAWLINHPRLVAYLELILGATVIVICCGYFIYLQESRQVLAPLNFEVSAGTLSNYRVVEKSTRGGIKYEGHFVFDQAPYYFHTQGKHLAETVIPSSKSISCIHLKSEVRPQQASEPTRCFGILKEKMEIVSASSTIADEKFAIGMLQAMVVGILIIGAWLSFSGVRQLRSS